MSEIVIRAAKAIRSVLAENGIDANNGFGLFISEQCARAAIAAMWDPTEAMCANASSPDARYYYRAMLTAALQEPV